MRVLFTAALLATVAVSGAPLFAQSSGIEGRVDRLEREMRAVQRKVFPGGGQMFAPQITPPDATATPGVPASSPVVDLAARVTALEAQATTMTGQIEQTQFRVRQLEEAFAAYKRTTDARLRALEEGATAVSGTGPAPAAGAVTPPPPLRAAVTPPAPARTPLARPATGGPASAAPPARPATAGARPAPATAARAAALAAVERPNTGDAPEDLYVYGFRLWEAKLYPEAQRVLREVVQKHPTHRRASYAQNLLGRSYLDAGAPAQAAIALYENYQKMPNGERAADSLFYLAQALRRLNKPSAEICRVYAELMDVYGTRIAESMRADVAAARTANNCR